MFRLGVIDTMMGLGHVYFDGFLWLGAVIGVSVIREARPGALVSGFHGGPPGGLDCGTQRRRENSG